MLKSEHKPSSKISPFPCLMRYESDRNNCIILAISKHESRITGTVICTFGGPMLLGFSTDCFNAECCREFKGTVTLSNE